MEILDDTFEDLPSWQRYLILMGAGMGSSKRGIQQVLNSFGAKHKALGTSDEDMEDISFNQKAVKKLSDATSGGWAAELAGNITDPISLALGGGGAGALTKVGASTVAKLMAPAALQGALAETKEGDSRAFNTAVSAMTPLAMKKAGDLRKVFAGEAQYDKLPDAQKRIFDELAANDSGGILKGRKYSQDLKNRAADVGMFPGYLDPNESNPWRAWVDLSDAYIPNKEYIDAPFFDVFRSKNLQKIAPELGDLKTSILKDRDLGASIYLPDGDIKAGYLESHARTPEEHFLNILHETQHFMQTKNKWPSGSNTGAWKSKVGPSNDDIGALLAYTGDMGEIEARDAAARFQYGALNDPNLKQIPAYSMHDKGINDFVSEGWNYYRPHQGLANRLPPGIAKDFVNELNSSKNLPKYPFNSNAPDRTTPLKDLLELRVNERGGPLTAGHPLLNGETIDLDPSVPIRNSAGSMQLVRTPYGTLKWVRKN